MSKLASSTVGQHSDTHRIQTHTRPGSRPTGRHLHLHRLHADMRLRDTHVRGTQQRVEQAYGPPLVPANPTPVCPHTQLCGRDRKQRTAQHAGSAVQPRAGRVSQPSGSVPSWSLSREAQCVISKQKESSSFAAGRKSRVWGWVGGCVGMCRGQGVCGGKQACECRGVYGGAWCTLPGVSKVGWGKEPRKQCAFVRVCVCR